MHPACSSLESGLRVRNSETCSVGKAPWCGVWIQDTQRQLSPASKAHLTSFSGVRLRGDPPVCRKRYASCRGTGDARAGVDSRPPRTVPPPLPSAGRPPLGETPPAWAPTGVGGARDRMGPNSLQGWNEGDQPLVLSMRPQEQKEASLPRGPVLLRRSKPATGNRCSKSAQGTSPRL